jgi:aldehyde dehydrogenase family protein
MHGLPTELLPQPLRRPAPPVCAEKLRSGRIGDEDRQEQVVMRWRRGAQSPDGTGHPGPAIDEPSLYFSRRQTRPGPALVDETANIADAARKIVWGTMAWGGQWCTSPGYAYVHGSVADAFVAEAKRPRSISMGLTRGPIRIIRG